MNGKRIAATAAAVLFAGMAVHGLDVMDGLMYAVPAASPPVIDGRLEDWDQSGREWVAISRDVAENFSGDVMVMYDGEALYLAAEVRTAGGPLVNRHKPGEKTWEGHSIEFRCIADPAVPFPLEIAENDRNHPSVRKWADRINTVTIWQETVTGTPHVTITNAPPFNGTRSDHDPAGTEVRFTEKTDPGRYIMEAKIPWRCLGVENGRNPFKPGDRMTAFWTVIWPQNLVQRAESLRIAPTNNFGWHYYGVKNWGRIEFAPSGNLPRRNPTLAEYLKISREAPDCDSFTVEMPEMAMLSVNIVDAQGRILREIAGGELHERGPVTLYWDGYDWYGNPMPPGEYRYKAYIHQPLEVVYAGAAGTSAKVAYETSDRKGNWGGNMGPPTSVTGGDDGIYLLWGSNEGGNSIVKIDYDRNVLWRNTPYVIEGGYGPHVSIAANKKYTYVLSGWFNTFITRYHAENGLSAAFGDKRFLALDSFGPTPPQQLSWNSPMPASNSIAVTDEELFVPFHYRGVIRVYDAQTGAFRRELPLEWPRGIALDEGGNLYALSGRDTNGWHGGPRRIWRFDRAQGKPRPVLTLPGGLCETPWGIAVRGGRIFVTDNGSSHRLLRFENGKLTGSFGKDGGRVRGGAYDSGSLLNPAGLGFDAKGRLWVAESSLPNVFKCVDPDRLTVSGELFGDVGYCPPAWPDADDPLLVYVKEYFTNGIIRSRLKGDGSSAGADAYWNFREMVWPRELTEWASNYRVPVSFRGPAGKKYMYAAALRDKPAALVLQEGDNLRPVNYIANFNWLAPRAGLRVWTDRNGDGAVDPAEITEVGSLGAMKLNSGGRPWVMGASAVTADGTLYLVGSDNCAYRIPPAETLKSGALVWNWAGAVKVAEKIIPYIGRPLSYGPREEIIGIDVDGKRNLYFSFSTNLPYANPVWAEQLKFGLGHTGRFNAVKVTAFDRDGRRIFLAGRKATGVVGDGEMYHHWAQAGLIGDEYMAVASEWTPFTLYTRDGFFVQTLLADPNRGGESGPYLLGGGETFSGQLRYFPERNECYLYTGNTHGMVYRLNGLDEEGRIRGEKRFEGKMTLTRCVDPFRKREASASAVLIPLDRPFKSGNWGDCAVVLPDNDGNKLADLDLGYDAEFLYARFRVKKNRPFVNGADDPAMVFKQGDAVGLYLGPKAGHKVPTDHDIRILGTVFQGKPAVIGMLPKSELKHPYEYFTTSGGRWKFDFVGILPGAEARFTPISDGYVMELAVPKKYLKGCELAPGGTLGLEAEVLVAGQGVRGLQVISRNHLFTPRSASQAKMVDDIPSEARSYPEYWGRTTIK